MDVWDALKLMARRWYIAVPMAVLTLLGAIFTFVTVQPHHVSEGHIMLLPPSAEVIVAEDGVSQSVNPWTTDSLMAAVITRLGNRALEAELAQEGYRASWEADTDLRFSSVVAIETRSDSPGDAQETLQRLMNVVEVEVEQQQQPYQLPPDAKITSLQLDAGENLELARGNQARALIVVVGIGGIMTLITTVSGDVLLRAYDRRRREPAAVPPPRPGGEPAAPPPGGNGNGAAPAAAPLPDDAGSRPVATTDPSDHRTVAERGPEPAPARRYPLDDATMMLPISREHQEESTAVGDHPDRGRGQ